MLMLQSRLSIPLLFGVKFYVATWPDTPLASCEFLAVVPYISLFLFSLSAVFPRPDFWLDILLSPILA